MDTVCKETQTETVHGLQWLKFLGQTEWKIGAVGWTFTLRLSSAASSFLWISSSETSFFLGGDRGNSPLPSGAGAPRMTSKAWPEARLSSSLTWISEHN